MIHIYLSETSKCSLHQQCGLNCLLKSLCWNPVLRTSIESDSSEPWGRWIGSNKLASLTGAPLRRGVLTKVYWQRSEHRGHSQKVAYWLTKKRAMEETQYADRLFHPRSPATRTMRKVTPVILWMSLVFFYCFILDQSSWRYTLLTEYSHLRGEVWPSIIGEDTVYLLALCVSAMFFCH